MRCVSKYNINNNIKLTLKNTSTKINNVNKNSIKYWQQFNKKHPIKINPIIKIKSIKNNKSPK